MNILTPKALSFTGVGSHMITSYKLHTFGTFLNCHDLNIIPTHFSITFAPI